jgi:hypothetical protein
MEVVHNSVVFNFAQSFQDVEQKKDLTFVELLRRHPLLNLLLHVVYADQRNVLGD